MKFIPQFSFFEFLGVIMFGTVISNYFLDRPLMNMTSFIIYCGFSGVIAGLNFFSRYSSWLKKCKSAT